MKSYHFCNVCSWKVKLITKEDVALQFAYDYDLFYDGGVCESTPNCQGNYHMVTDWSTKYGFHLRCLHCGKTKSLLFNSIFTRSHLQINKVVHLIYCWALEYPCELAAHDVKVSLPTVSNFFQAFRQACRHSIENEHQQPIGGVGYNVEIDEFIKSKSKNNVVRVLNEIWVFGGVCRETHERFIFKVDNQNSETLLPIIEEILPGSIIHSDGWRANNGIPSLQNGYRHFVVNH